MSPGYGERLTTRLFLDAVIGTSWWSRSCLIWLGRCVYVLFALEHAQMFAGIYQLMETYSVALVASQDPDLKQCMLLSSFSAVSARREYSLWAVLRAIRLKGLLCSICRTTLGIF